MSTTIEPQWQPNPFRGQRVLQLACGARPIRGAVNHDRVRHGDYVDAWCDLDRMPWVFESAPDHALGPWRLTDDGAVTSIRSTPGGIPFDAIIARDIFEHLVDPYGAVNECWSLLHVGGVLIIRMSAWDNPATFADLTHKHRASDEAMDFFDRTTRLGGHYGPFHPSDSLGRLTTPWRIDGVDRVNPDHRWPDHGDLQFTMVKLAAHPEPAA